MIEFIKDLQVAAISYSHNLNNEQEELEEIRYDLHVRIWLIYGFTPFNS